MNAFQRSKPTRVFEMLDLVESMPTHEEKIKMLQHLRCFELEAVLQMNYHPAVQLDLPPGAISFAKDDGDPDSSIMRTRNAIPEFRDLVKSSKLSQASKVKKYVGLLESVNEREAEVFLLMKDRKLSQRWPSITLALVRQALPGVT